MGAMGEPEPKEDEAPLAIGMTAIKPEGWDKTGLDAFKDVIYNPQTGEILTRTPLSWLKIITFYIIYYSFLCGFWIACLFVFFQTLPYTDQGPRWKQDYSLIGMNPGVGFRPRSADTQIDSNMFLLKAGATNKDPSGRKGEGELNADYAVRLQEYMKTYENKTMGKNLNGNDYKEFDTDLLGDCAEFPYGYVAEGAKSVAPCIFLKLNTIWGWTPQRTTFCTEEKEPCPESLKKHLDSEDAKEAGTENVWLDCYGRYPADKEALADDGLTYFPPSRAIPISAFPYEGKSSGVYHSPLVALKVNPSVIGQMIHIECKAHHMDAVHNTKDKTGLVQFEVMIRNDY